jgi:hypothetical protein
MPTEGGLLGWLEVLVEVCSGGWEERAASGRIYLPGGAQKTRGGKDNRIWGLPIQG